MRRTAAMVVSVVGLVIVMLVTGAVIGGLGRPTAPASGNARDVAAQPAQVMGGAAIAGGIVSLQTRLRTVPRDWSAWASLGALYTAQARLTVDPSYYGKADGAFAKSLQIEPKDNAAALSGQAALASSRHDFTGALALTQRVEKLNAYSTPNLGVMVDALVELGRYPEAFAALQRMVNLKPGVASFARISYSYELRGDITGARYALDQTLAVAQSPSDRAFALQYLGELAFNHGDLATAQRQFVLGLRQDAGYMPLLAGRARVEAAQGKTAAAIRDYGSVVARLPQPSYLIEYGDLLASLGRHQEAVTQYAVVGAEEKLFMAAGVNVDLELALFDADHGRSAAAFVSATAEWDRRKSVLVEDAYAWALHVNGRDKEALVHAKGAARTGMANALFAYHRGMIEKSLGLDAAATTSLKRALQINPYFSTLLAPTARAALRSLEKAR